MDKGKIFAILEIPETKDEEQIRAAYRALLSQVNPEDDPEGFKELRRAYEEALAYARSDDSRDGENEGDNISGMFPVPDGVCGEFIQKVAEVYHSISRRTNPAEWKELMKAPVLQSLDEGEPAKWALFSWLSQNFRLPCAIWKYLDEVFSIQDNKSEFAEHMPTGFVHYMLYMIVDEDEKREFPFGKFEGADDADYDGFLQEYMALSNENEEKTKKALLERGRKLKQMERFGIKHPWFSLEKTEYLAKSGKTEEAARDIRVLMEQNKEDEKIQLAGANILLDCGFTEEAAAIFEGYLEQEERTGHGIYLAAFGLACIEASQKNWEEAYTLAADAGRQEYSEELNELLTQIQEELISLYIPNADTLTQEQAVRLLGCFLRLGKNEEGMAFAEAYPKYHQDTAEWHRQIAWLALVSGDAQKALSEVAFWENCIAAGESKEPEKEEAACAHVKGRALNVLYRRKREEQRADAAGEEGQEAEKMQAASGDSCEQILAQALAAHDRAIELCPDDIDYRMLRMLLLRDAEDYRQVVDACEQILELDGQFFWACYYMQEAYEKLRMAQEVVDSFYRAKAIYAGHPDIYLRALKVFMAYGQYQDAMGILEQAEEAGAESHELMVKKIAVLEEFVEDNESCKRADEWAEQVIRRLKKEKASDELLAEAYMQRAYVNDTVDRDYPCIQPEMDRKCAEKALRLVNSARTKYYLARYYVEKEIHYKKAYRYLKECEEDGMDYEWMFFYIAKCHEEFKEWDKAIEYYKKMAEKNPDSRACYWRIAWLYRRKLGRTLQPEYAQEALRYLEIQEEKCGESSMNFRQKALVHRYMREYETALAEVEQGLALRADSWMWQTKGQLLMSLDRYDEAIECFENAITTEDRYGEDDGYSAGQIFQILLKKNDIAACIAYMEKAEEAVLSEEAKQTYQEKLSDAEAIAGHYDRALYWLEKRYGSVDITKRTCDNLEEDADRIEAILYVWLRFMPDSEAFEEAVEKCRLAAATTEQAAEDESASYADRALICHNMGEMYSCLDEHEKAAAFLEQAWKLSRKAKGYTHTENLLLNLMESYYWAGDLKKAKFYGEKYKKELSKKYKECEGLGLTMEELLTRETTESRNTLYSMFCYAYYTGQYDLARTYAKWMSERCMCYWCNTDGCTEMLEVQGILAMHDGRIEEAKACFEQANRACFRGDNTDARMLLRRLLRK